MPNWNWLRELAKLSEPMLKGLQHSYGKAANPELRFHSPSTRGLGQEMMYSGYNRHFGLQGGESYKLGGLYTAESPSMANKLMSVPQGREGAFNPGPWRNRDYMVGVVDPKPGEVVQMEDEYLLHRAINELPERANKPWGDIQPKQRKVLIEQLLREENPNMKFLELHDVDGAPNRREMIQVEPEQMDLYWKDMFKRFSVGGAAVGGGALATPDDTQAASLAQFKAKRLPIPKSMRGLSNVDILSEEFRNNKWYMRDLQEIASTQRWDKKQMNGQELLEKEMFNVAEWLQRDPLNPVKAMESMQNDKVYKAVLRLFDQEQLKRYVTKPNYEKLAKWAGIPLAIAGTVGATPEDAEAGRLIQFPKRVFPTAKQIAAKAEKLPRSIFEVTGTEGRPYNRMLRIKLDGSEIQVVAPGRFDKVPDYFGKDFSKPADEYKMLASVRQRLAKKFDSAAPENFQQVYDFYTSPKYNFSKDTTMIVAESVASQLGYKREMARGWRAQVGKKVHKDISTHDTTIVPKGAELTNEHVDQLIAAGLDPNSSWFKHNVFSPSTGSKLKLIKGLVPLVTATGLVFVDQSGTASALPVSEAIPYIAKTARLIVGAGTEQHQEAWRHLGMRLRMNIPGRAKMESYELKDMLINRQTKKWHLIMMGEDQKQFAVPLTREEMRGFLQSAGTKYQMREYADADEMTKRYMGDRSVELRQGRRDSQPTLMRDMMREEIRQLERIVAISPDLVEPYSFFRPKGSTKDTPSIAMMTTMARDQVKRGRGTIVMHIPQEWINELKSR